MFSKEERREANRKFWIQTGVYLGRNRSASGKKVKWVGYKTGLKDVYLRLEADHQCAKICIDLQHRDDGIRQLFFDQFVELKRVFTDSVGEFVWVENFYKEDIQKEISRIYIQENDINMYEQKDWKAFYLFFEKYLVGFDEFWVEFFDVFKELES